MLVALWANFIPRIGQSVNKIRERALLATINDQMPFQDFPVEF
jgi:hypothetical protein